MIEHLRRLLEPLRRKIDSVVVKGTVKSTDDSKTIQIGQFSLRYKEVIDDVERFQNYGFSSKPKSGAESIILFPCGVRENGIAIAVDDRRFRFKNLQDGEVALYTDEGDVLHFKRGNIIEVKAGDSLMTLNNGKFSLANSSEGEELLTVLDNLVDELISWKNITGIGPQPAHPSTLSALNQIKTRLGKLKE